MLRNLKHANIVTLHDIIYTEAILTLVFEFMEHDLREYMEEVDGMICMNNVKVNFNLFNIFFCVVLNCTNFFLNLAFFDSTTSRIRLLP